MSTGWHKVPVAAIEALADDAVAIDLAIPGSAVDEFDHTPGQHITVRHVIDGTEVRRSYSICDRRDDAEGMLRIVVKRVAAGGFAEYAATHLRTGDELEIGSPTGDFAIRPAEHHVMIAGGSGITPLLSMARRALRSDGRCRVSLVYVNRTSASTLLADELGDLKDDHPTRFFPLYVLTQETRETHLLSGTPDRVRLAAMLDALGSLDDTDSAYYLCGPWALVDSSRTALAELGVEERRVHFELFSTGESTPDRPRVPGAGTGCTVIARYAGRQTSTAMGDADRVVLDPILRARPEIPYSCRDGLCGVCRAGVVRGRVVMDRHYALGDDDIERGYVLACRASAMPGEQTIELDFDA